MVWNHKIRENNPSSRQNSQAPGSPLARLWFGTGFSMQDLSTQVTTRTLRHKSDPSFMLHTKNGTTIPTAANLFGEWFSFEQSLKICQ